MTTQKTDVRNVILLYEGARGLSMHDRIRIIFEQCDQLLVDLMSNPYLKDSPVWDSTNYNVGADLVEDGWNRNDLSVLMLGIGFKLAAVAQLPEEKG